MAKQNSKKETKKVQNSDSVRVIAMVTQKINIFGHRISLEAGKEIEIPGVVYARIKGISTPSGGRIIKEVK